MDYKFLKLGIWFILMSSKDLFRIIVGGLKSGRVVVILLERFGKDYVDSIGVVLKCSCD